MKKQPMRKDQHQSKAFQACPKKKLLFHKQEKGKGNKKATKTANQWDETERLSVKSFLPLHFPFALLGKTERKKPRPSPCSTPCLLLADAFPLLFPVPHLTMAKRKIKTSQKINQ
jgi:hypothetical protein